MASERPFVHLWREAVRDSDLDRTAKLVAFVLSTYMNATGSAYPSKPTIATGAGLGHGARSVDAAVDRLEESGYVLVGRRRGNRGFTYQAAIPQAVRDGNTQPVRDSSRSRVQSIPHPATNHPARAATEVVLNGNEVVPTTTSAAAPTETADYHSEIQHLIQTSLRSN